MTKMAIRLDHDCGPYMEDATGHEIAMAALHPDIVRIVDLPDHFIEFVRHADSGWRLAQEKLAQWAER